MFFFFPSDVTSLQADAGTPISGIITLASGTNMSLTEANQTITVNSGVTYPLTPSQVQPASHAIAALAIDWSLTFTYSKTLSANSTFTFSNAADGMTIIVALTNTSGNYTVTWPTVQWSGGTPPVQTTGAKTDVWTFVKIGSTIYGSVVQNLS